MVQEDVTECPYCLIKFIIISFNPEQFGIEVLLHPCNERLYVIRGNDMNWLLDGSKISWHTDCFEIQRTLETLSSL